MQAKAIEKMRSAVLQYRAYRYANGCKFYSNYITLTSLVISYRLWLCVNDSFWTATLQT